MARNIFKSSAKNIKSEQWVLAHKAVTKILKNKGPKGV
jgi:hypothetical protein